jgi:hypothetical protein
VAVDLTFHHIVATEFRVVSELQKETRKALGRDANLEPNVSKLYSNK